MKQDFVYIGIIFNRLDNYNPRKETVIEKVRRENAFSPRRLNNK